MYGRNPYQGQVPPPPQPGQGLTSNPGGFGQGVAQFMNTYRAEKERRKEEARKKFEQGLNLLQQGLPLGELDTKKMAKLAREAGFPLDFDGSAPNPTPPPPAQAPMTPDPRMQAVAQHGMQQALGGPAAQPAPPPAPPPQQGFMGRLAGAIGQATGAPQPPGQAQQMGLMKMLQDIEQRGVQSRETEGMKANLQKSVLGALNTINQGIQMDLDYTDPRIAKAIQTLVMVGGGQSGKMDVDALGKILSIPGFREAFGPIAKVIDQRVAKEEDQELRKTLAKDMGPDAYEWIKGETDKPPKTPIDNEKFSKFVTEQYDKFPGANPEDVKAYAYAVFADGFDPALVGRLRSKLGDSIDDIQREQSAERLKEMKKTGDRADQALALRTSEKAYEDNLNSGIGQMLDIYDNGDPAAAAQAALSNMDRLMVSAFGKEEKRYRPDVVKILKSMAEKKQSFADALAEGLKKYEAEKTAR